MCGLAEGVWWKECVFVVGEDLMTKEIIGFWFKQRLLVLLVPY